MKSNFTILLYLALFALPSYGWAQTDKQNRDQADYYYRHYAFSEAISLYASIKDKTFQDNVRLGDCYRLTNFPADAARYYGKAVTTDDGTASDIRLHYGQVLMTLGKYKDAEKWLTLYYKKHPSDGRIKNLILSCRTAGKRMAATPRGYATFLADLNTDKNEFAPTVWNKKLIFTSDSTYQVSKKNDKWTGNSFFNIYMASFDSARQTYGGEITTAPRAQKGNIRYHDGPCTFAGEVNEMYFTRTRTKRGGKNSKQNKDSIVLLSIMVGSDYDTVTGVFRKVTPFAFNSKSYSIAHPAISPDGKTLFFASDKKGGSGGYDLYVCKRQSNGDWLPPENLGKQINTEGDELFPFLADSKTLCFSSDGQKDCLGGLDVYKSTLNGNIWSAPENSGTPVNSSYDDISLALHNDGSNSFFSSNRPAKTGGDNVYLFESKKLFILIDVMDSATQKPLPAAAIRLFDAIDTFTAKSDNKGMHMSALSPQFPYGYKVSVTLDGYDTVLTNSVFNGSDKPKDTIRVAVRLGKLPVAPKADSCKDRKIIFNLKIIDCRTGKKINDTGGKVNVTFDTSVKRINYHMAPGLREGALTRELFPGMEYMLELSSYDYKALYATKINTTFQTTTDTVINDSVCLEQEVDVIDLGQIPFDYDNAILSATAMSRLTRFVKYLNELQPTMKLLIRGHTDCRELKPGYNKMLSEKRAHAVMNYLVQNGVTANRLRAVGVGDNMPRIRCNNCETDESKEQTIKKHYIDGKTDCDADDHAKNRYIDCVILSY